MKTNEDDLPLKKRCYWRLRFLANLAINEEQFMKKEKSKILHEKYCGKFKLFECVPQKIRTSRYTREKNTNLNCGVHHLSSLEPCDNMADTETKSPLTSDSDPSSSLTENTSSKGKRSHITSNDKSKKFNVFSLLVIDREAPEWMVQMMREKNISEMPTLILERALSASDVDKGLSRLLMPFNMLKRNDFFTLRESEIIKEGVGTILVDERFRKWGLRVTIWGMGKQDQSKGTSNYALNWGWYDVVEGNNLKAGDEISLWSFRDRGVLCFALEHRPQRN